MRIGVSSSGRAPGWQSLTDGVAPSDASPTVLAMDDATGKDNHLGVENVGQGAQARTERKAGIVDDVDAALVTGTTQIVDVAAH